MKHSYEKPEMDILEFLSKDIIRSSGGMGNGSGPGANTEPGWGPIS